MHTFDSMFMEVVLGIGDMYKHRSSDYFSHTAGSCRRSNLVSGNVEASIALHSSLANYYTLSIKSHCRSYNLKGETTTAKAYT